MRKNLSDCHSVCTLRKSSIFLNIYFRLFISFFLSFHPCILISSYLSILVYLFLSCLSDCVFNSIDIVFYKLLFHFTISYFSLLIHIYIYIYIYIHEVHSIDTGIFEKIHFSLRIIFYKHILCIFRNQLIGKIIWISPNYFFYGCLKRWQIK